jgi:hypothetical protein
VRGLEQLPRAGTADERRCVVSAPKSKKPPRTFVREVDAKELLGDAAAIDRALVTLMSRLAEHAIAQDVVHELTTIASHSESVRLFAATFTGKEAMVTP